MNAVNTPEDIQTRKSPYKPNSGVNRARFLRYLSAILSDSCANELTLTQWLGTRIWQHYKRTNKSRPRKIYNTNSQTSVKNMGWRNYIILPKKGDLTYCGNRRGTCITLIRSTSKILGKLSLKELQRKWTNT